MPDRRRDRGSVAIGENGDMRPGSPRHRLRGSAIATALVLLVVTSGLASGCGLFDEKVDVLLIGDSIMNQSGDFVVTELRRQPNLGDVNVKKVAVNGSGLMTPRVYDWMSKTDELIRKHKPKMVVALFVGNYSDTDLFIGADGTQIPNDYSQRFFEEWGVQARKLTSIVQSNGAVAEWVLPPPFNGQEGKRREDAMRTVYVKLARDIPGVGLIDGRQALGDAQGNFTWKLPDVNGQVQTVRQGDTVHLTEPGGQLMARQIAFAIGPKLSELRRQTAV